MADTQTVETELAELYALAEAQDAGRNDSETAETVPLGGEEATKASDDPGKTAGASDKADEPEKGAADDGKAKEAKAEAKAELDDKKAGEPNKAPESNPEDKTASDKAKDEPTRAEKKAAALERTWENAEKRHKDAEAREIALLERERTLNAREQQLAQLSRQVETPEDPLPKHSFDALADTLSEFLDEGDVATAKQLAKSLAAKAAAQVRAAAPGLQNPRFREAWEQTRQQVIKANPELNDPKSELFTRASGLLSGDWAPLFQAHPAGTAAAVEVAKLQLQLGKEAELAEQVKKLTAEVESLRKKTQLDGATPTSRERKQVAFESLSLEQQLAAVQREAEAIDRGR